LPTAVAEYRSVEPSRDGTPGRGPVLLIALAVFALEGVLTPFARKHAMNFAIMPVPPELLAWPPEPGTPPPASPHAAAPFFCTHVLIAPAMPPAVPFALVAGFGLLVPARDVPELPLEAFELALGVVELVVETVGLLAGAEAVGVGFEAVGVLAEAGAAPFVAVELLVEATELLEEPPHAASWTLASRRADNTAARVGVWLST